MYLCNAAAEGRIFLHLRYIVQQEEKLTVARARDHCKLLTAVQISVETAVEDFLLATHLFCIGFPALSVRRIREHKVKLPCSIAVQRQR